MISILSRILSRVSGGSATVTVPSMDGALRPNQALDDADIAWTIDAPDNIIALGSGVLFSSGNCVYETQVNGRPLLGEHYKSSVACLSPAPSGGYVVGLSDGTLLVRGGRFDGVILSEVGGRPIVCPTALTVFDDSNLLLCLGSASNSPDHWRRDLLQKGSTGSIWKIDLATKASTCLAGGLAFPYGIVVDADRRVIASESWRHRVVALRSGESGLDVLLDDLPGYPARLVASTHGSGTWLSVFAPRRPVVELILQERSFREEMMAEISEENWMAPALSSGQYFQEPLLGGAVKQLGILKPWAPTRSYGLVVRLSSSYQPIASFHSRGNGVRHGITSCVELNDRVLVTSKGGNAVLSLPISSTAGASA